MRSELAEPAAEIVERAKGRKREYLTEAEGYELLAGAGFRVPFHRVVPPSATMPPDLQGFPGDQVVVKVMSPAMAHRSHLGGVAVVERDPGTVQAAIRSMEERFQGQPIDGFLVAQHVDHDRELGGEILLGARWTDDFGPVVSFGPGGVDGEDLCRELREGRDVAVFSSGSTRSEEIWPVLQRNAITPWITGTCRGGRPRATPEQLRELLLRFLRLAESTIPGHLREIEVNPMAMTPDGPIALDVLARLGDGPPPGMPRPRPLRKMSHLLSPDSMAVIGVSERMNPGRRILQNVLRAGFDRSHLYVVKPGIESLDGCRCVPGLAALPEPVDLLVVSLDAARAVAAVEEAIETDRARSIILIPGGLGEHGGGRELDARLRGAIEASRSGPGRGPVINGGNCLGIRSVPGRYDTMFIPEEKTPAPPPVQAPLALIAQSGAFACSRASKLPDLQPRYNISVGNQVDLTVGDYLTYLADDSSVEVFACYVEGFRPGDGERFLQAARTIRDSGRSVVVYRAGRSAAGVAATSSHTASVAGDYVVARELLTSAGALVAPGLADFDEMVRLLCLLRARPPGGSRIGALSNAGFECVAMADNLGPFSLAELGKSTLRGLQTVLDGSRLGGVVEVHNPLDLTPIAADAAYEAATRAILEDANVDLGLIGCVPMTGALETLPDPSSGERDAPGFGDGSVVERLIRVHRDSSKPWVAVVDAGPMYDDMAARLQAGGVPTFRCADRALQLLAACFAHLGIF